MLEQEVVSELLFDLSKVKVIEISGKWFKNRNLRYIVDFVIETEGEENDYLLMVDKIKEKHPDAELTKDLVIELATQSVTNAHLERHLKELKLRYYEERVVYYSQEYAKNPSKERESSMKMALIELEEERSRVDKRGLRETVDELYYELEHGMKSGIHTYESIDNILGDGFSGGMLVTVGARPSVGKTTFGVNLNMEALYNHEDITADFFSLEMTKKEMLKKFVSRMTELNSYKFVNTKLQLKDNEKSQVVASAEWLAKQDFTIHDDLFHFEEIIRMIRRRKAEAGGKYIAFIDYLQLIRGNNKANRYLEIGEITRELKRVANRLDIPIVMFSQLSRGLEARQDKTPTLADLRESGDIEQDSSVVIFLHQDEEETDITLATVAKNRNGATGQIPFRFFKSKSKFDEVQR